MKLKVAVCLALLVCILTFVISFARDVRVFTAFYRAGISFLVFLGVGFVGAFVAEKFLRGMWAGVADEEVNLAITEDTAEEEVTEDDMLNSAAFTPLTPDDLERVARPKE